MPDEVATSTPAQTATPKREFKIPIEHATPADHTHAGRQFKIPIEYETMTVDHSGQDTSAEGLKQQAAKSGVKVDVGVAKAYTPSWWERIKNTAGFSGARGAASDASRVAEVTGDKMAALHEFSDHPLLAFEELFPANPKSMAGQVAKGAAHAVSGMTTPSQVALMGAPVAAGIAKAEALAQAVHAVGLAMMPTIAEGLHQSAKQIQQARKTGDTASENEAWGEAAANVAMIAVPHYGGELLEHRQGTKVLNEHAQATYSKPFKELSDPEKAHVLYKTVEDASPKFKKRVDAEVKRINQRKTATGATVAEERAEDRKYTVQAAEDNATRVQAAKTVINRIIEQHNRNEQYKAAQAKVEAKICAEQEEKAVAARRQQYEKEKAQDPAGGTSPSLEERRGFAVKEDRHIELGKLRDNDLADAQGRETTLEPSDASVLPKVNDERPLSGEMVPVQRASELERPVQEFAEQKMGASFSSLPLDRQKVVARYFERFQPEKWDAFKGTQAYDSYRRHADMEAAASPVWQRYMNRHEGSGETLQPGADEHVGMARLLIGQTDLPSTLKAAPEVARALNEYSEKNFGPSFDSLEDQDKPAALAGFLRENPDKASTFMSEDVAKRVRNGQHIDLANMEADLRDKRQVETLMQYRDATRAAMDTEFAGEAIRQARAEHVSGIQDVLQKAPTEETSAGEILTEQVKGLTRLAESINLDGITSSKDLFHVEHAIQSIPEADRTAAMREYLAQAKRVRLAAQDQVVREYRERMTRELRKVAPAESATVSRPIAQEFAVYGPVFERAAHEVVELEDQRSILNRQADHLSGEHATPEQKAEAQELRETAAFVRDKQMAVVAAHEVVTNGSAPSVKVEAPAGMVMGREAAVVLENGTRVPVHYAVVDADNLIPSHKPFTYEEDARFPQEAQPRNYKAERALQVGVETRAAGLDEGQILSDTSLPIDGPPIIRKDGVVLGGNGRTQSMKLAILTNDGRGYESIRRRIFEKAAQFGISPDAIANVKNPVLVRVMDVDPETRADLVKYGIEFNREPGMGQSEVEQATSLARLITPEVTQALAGVMESLPPDVTLRTAMRNRSGDIARILQGAGFIPTNKMVEYIDGDGELTEKAKQLVENTVMGSTVTRPEVLQRASDSTRDRLGRVGMDFIRLRTAGDKWAIASPNTDAVELLTRAQDQKSVLDMMRKPGEKETAKADSLVERMLHPERYVDTQNDLMFDDQPTHAPVNPVVEALAMALEENSRDYAKLIHDYVGQAVEDGASIFGARHPAEVFTEAIGAKYGIDVLPEEWGMVGALPDGVRAELAEATEAPLPIEPEAQAEVVQADTEPDVSMVHEMTIGNEVKSVREFRKALAELPEISEEQATAIADIFEKVLPNAIGESFENVLNNRMLRIRIGGEKGSYRGAMTFIGDSQQLLNVFQSGDASTVLHEMAHFVREYLKPGDQAVLNEFVGAKPGEEWTVDQEEKFAQAFERYHYDGGRRRGALEKAFAVIHKAMQALYDAVTGSNLVKPSAEVAQMFDRWYDWTRSERQPITKRINVDELEASVKDAKVVVPPDAKLLESTSRVAPNGRTFVFVSKGAANEFIDRNSGSIRTYALYEAKDKSAYYVKADAIGKRLYQSGLASLGDLARQAKQLEEQLKRTADPRDEARLRAMLNSIENKMGGSTLIFGAEPAKTAETRQLVYGLGDMPSVAEPTTPAQAATVQQVYGDPTAFEVGGGRARTERVPDEVPRNEPNATERVPEQTGQADGQHGTSGQPLRGDAGDSGRTGAKSDKSDRKAVDPLSKVPAAALKAPERKRGTPVVSPEVWKEHAAALGFPEGTPPPTVRIPQDLRDMMIYPGQPEAIELALSSLQQYDGVVVAAPTGSGKTYMASALADQLLGGDANKVGLVITRARNLITDSDGYIDVGRKMGVEFEMLPRDINDVQGGGVYAGTYASIRGDKDILSIPWDFVIFDEAAEGRKWMDSEQGKQVVLLGHAAKKVVYMSATPWHTAVEVGYAHKLGMWPHGGFFEWARQFGVVETGPNSYTGGYAPKKLLKLRQQLVERGQWVTLHRDMEGVSAHVGLVKLTPEAKAGIKSIRDTFLMASKIFTEQGKSAYARAAKAHEVIYLKRYIEAQRLPHAMEAARRAIANGWSPILFSEYRSGTEKGMEFFKHLPAGMGEALNKMLPPLPDVVETVRAELGDKAAVFAGSANELRAEEREAYMSGAKQAVYATYAAGGVGVGFHDKVGNRPRMGIFLGLPWSGIMFEQSLGRTWRYGTKSNVANLFLTSDALPEMKVLATKILPRMRALNAVVHGEAVEGHLAKMLRESAGIHEDMVDYDMGGEDAPDAAQFAQTVDHEVNVTGPEVVHDLKSKDAIGPDKGMKYKQKPKQLYQGPKDQIGKDATDAMLRQEREAKSLPPWERRALASAAPVVHAEAVLEGRKAMAAEEPVRPAIERKVKDAKTGLKLALGESGMLFMHDRKVEANAIKNFAKEWILLRHTAGEQAVRKYMEAAGMPKEGREIQRKLIERSHLKTEYQGELLAQVSEIIADLRPEEHPKVVRVLEGKATSDDPRIMKAAEGYRKFFDDVRKRLGDAGATMKFYSDGKEVTLGYNQIEKDENYWPHIYDWNKKIVLNNEVVTLGEIHDMPSNSQRREKLIEQYAAKRGITKLQADAFFEKNRRGTRLAGNIEKGRRTTIPDYDDSQRAISVYVNQVSELLANIKTVGQYREKVNPAIMMIPDMDTQKVVNSIITSDLNPMAMGETNKRFLRLASQWTVLTKMGLSSLKLPFHGAKTSLVTNTRSLIGGLLSAATSPREAVRSARDAGILTDYVREAMMMEYGLHSGGLDQKMLMATGFTPMIWLSRIVAGASGRVFLERYAAPALAKNPEDVALRRKLKDLYAFSDEDMDRIAKSGYNEHDVKRAMIASADWTTGSGRPSELPATLRIVDEHPITRHFNAFVRLTWQLKTFTFKTANLVNRTVVEGLRQQGWSNKEYQAVGRMLVNFGAAGLGLRMMQIGVNSIANPSAAAEEKRRLLAALHNPKDALWLELGNVSYAIGLYPAKVLFDQLGTHNPGDLKKMQQQRRLENALFEQGGGILASDFDHIGRSAVEWMQTFSDDGTHHKTSAADRREAILKRLAQQEITPVRLGFGLYDDVTGKKPEEQAAAKKPHTGHHHGGHRRRVLR